MKIFALIFLVLFTENSIVAQNHYDYNWFFPRGNLGGIHLNFANDSLHIGYIPDVSMRAVEAHISMSDQAGNLIFYSNNCSISNAAHEIMENGDGLNPGVIQTYWCSVNPFANPYNQSAIAIPFPGDTSKYLIFHVDSELYNFGGPGGSYSTPNNLLSTLIDISQDNGSGEVIEKNAVILTDTLASSKLSAVKHANGRDWWLIVPEYQSNCYYTILVDPIKNTIIGKHCIGYIWNKYDEAGGSLFSPLGDKYIRANDMNGLNIFDFNRCTGLLSNPIQISLAPDTNTVSSISISPSGRFFYYNTLTKIYQFDLLAQDIAASKALVATYDGFISAGNPTDFYHARLAPDGNIYICTFGPTYYLHTINEPDSAGVACQVLQHFAELPITHFASVPNYPNYRLGMLPGPCDTITVSATELEVNSSLPSVLANHPNPFSEATSIDYTVPQKAQQVQLIIMDASGKVVLQKELAQRGAGSVEVNMKALSTGTYYYYLDIDGTKTASQKMLLQK